MPTVSGRHADNAARKPVVAETSQLRVKELGVLLKQGCLFGRAPDLAALSGFPRPAAAAAAEPSSSDMRFASCATRPSCPPPPPWACPSGDKTRSTVVSNGEATAAALAEDACEVSIELLVRKEPPSACSGTAPDQATNLNPNSKSQFESPGAKSGEEPDQGCGSSFCPHKPRQPAQFHLYLKLTAAVCHTPQCHSL